MLLSIAVLGYSSEKFVSYAAIFSERLGLSSVVTGVVIVGFGTSLPELFTAGLASFAHEPEVGVASAVGATVINTTLVAAVAAIFVSPKVSGRALRKEGIVAIAAALLLVVLLAVPFVLAGYLLLLTFILGTIYTLWSSSQDSEGEVEAELHAAAMSVRPGLAILYSLGGLLGTLAAAEGFLHAALAIAQSLRVPQVVTGGVIVSIGTSLPELATAIQSARKGLGGLVLGNVLGSSYFNMLAVAGTAMMLAPHGSYPALRFPSVMMAISVVMLWNFMRSGSKLSRPEGVWLLLVYVSYLASTQL